MPKSDEPFSWDEEIEVGDEPVYKNDTNRYVTTLSRKGERWYIGVRLFWTPDKNEDTDPSDKEWRPGRQGISFPVDIAEEVFAQVSEALDEVKKRVGKKGAAKPKQKVLTGGTI
jgi:hypothetical protein